MRKQNQLEKKILSKYIKKLKCNKADICDLAIFYETRKMFCGLTDLCERKDKGKYKYCFKRKKQKRGMG